jgi:bifunctional DNA-binding transcriptional regulator/antitoxin component of YhaV-PrlF toxin-antitoxin module
MAYLWRIELIFASSDELTIIRLEDYMPQVKVQSDRQVRIPAHIFTKYRLRQGDILEVRDAGNGIVFIPKNGQQKLTKEHFFELIERTWARNRNIDSRTLDRTINRAVRAYRAEERKRLGR